MSQDVVTERVRRWQLVTFATLAILVGYVAGQLTPSTSAQPAATAVQLSTANCRTGSFTPDASDRFDVQRAPEGAIVTATYTAQRPSGTVERRFVYAVCP